MSDEAQIQVGDLVMLKTKDGPTMVVNSIGSMYNKNATICVWFENNQRREGEFDIRALMPKDQT